ncbi:MAG TPA: hypothetical protein VKR41_05115 [Puia sp.]|nr:hypothetical protein [Puia sp.]
MAYAPYTDLEATPDFATFQFTSPTPPEPTVRQVRFNGQLNNQPGGRIYNVEFRSKTTDRRDDPSWPDSKDFLCTVLTVLQIIEIYSERYPGRILRFSGDSKVKAQVFGTILGRFHHLLASLFDVETERPGPGSPIFQIQRKPIPCLSVSTVESIWHGTSQIFHNRFSIKLDKRIRIGLTLPTG